MAESKRVFSLSKLMFVLGCVSIAVGCSNSQSHLSRSGAAEVIRKYLQSAFPISVRGPFEGEWNPRLDELTTALVRLGYIQLHPGLSGGHYVVVTAQGWGVAEKQEKYRIGSGRTFAVRVATPELVEITGITQEGNNATVEFNWRCVATPMGRELQDAGVKNWTAFGVRCLDGPVEPMSKNLRLYDDGWRIVVQ